MTIESHTATYKQLYVQSHTIRQVTNCTTEWTLPCNYRLWQYGCCPPFFRLQPLTCWLLYNDHWNGSFSLTDTAWTLWYVSIRDHSSNSNDCCCGSQSRLMTSATGWGKCPPWCLSHSAHPSVSRPLEVTSYFGRHTVKRIFEYMHSSIHTWKKTDTHHPSW